MSVGKYRASHSGSCAMNFSQTLIFSLLLYRRILFSEGSFLSERSMIQENNVLGKFFTAWIPLMKQHGVQQTAVIETPYNQIVNVEVLLKAFPSFIGNNVREICTSSEFAPQCPIFYFLASAERKYITKQVDSLVGCKRNRLVFIFDEIFDYHDVEFVLRITFEKLALAAILIFSRKESVELYAYMKAPDCSTKTELLQDWVPGNDLQKLKAYYTDNMYDGCEISVGTMHRPPWMNLAEDEKGVLKMIGGSEADLISTIAQKMNVTPRVREYKLDDEYSSKNEHPTLVGCTTGDMDICIGHIQPTKLFISSLDVSQSYALECIVWCVPRTTNFKGSLMTSEFSWSTWLLMGLTFLMSFTVERIVRNIPRLNRGSANRSRRCLIILDMVGSTLGNPIIHRPLSVGSKFLLMSYLSYSLVMTTAYKTSLSSMLTLDNSEASIVDVAGIAKANLTIGGNFFKLRIFEMQMKSSKLMSDLRRRFVVESNVTKALLRVSNDKDFAYLTSLSELDYHEHLLAKAGNPVSLHVLNECWIIHNAVMVFPKSSHLTGTINNIMLRLAQSGLLTYWEEKSKKWNKFKSSETLNTPESLCKLTREKLFYIFRIYCLALFFCTLVFVGELLVHKFNFAERLGRFENWTRVKLRKLFASSKPFRLSNRQIRTP